MLEANSSRNSSKKKKLEEKENHMSPIVVEFSFDKSGFISNDNKVKHSPVKTSSKKRSEQEIQALDISSLTNKVANLDISTITNDERVPREDGFTHLHHHQLASNVPFCKLKVSLIHFAKMTEPLFCV